MSIWFTIQLKPVSGSLAAAAAALATAKIAIEGVVGSPESEDGILHLAVANDALERAIAALQSAGISVQLNAGGAAGGAAGDAVEASDTDGLIGAILNGPRT